MQRFRVLRDWVRAPAPTLLETVAWIILALAVATGLRAALTPWLGENLAYATYPPFVLALTLRFGWRTGLGAALLAAPLSAWLFMTDAPGAYVTAAHLVAAAVFIGMSGLVIATAELLRRAFRELDTAAKQQAAMNAELQHRVKNSLAVVQALAAQTGRAAVDFESFYEDFRGRLLALAAAHDLLSSGAWSSCELSLLAQETLKPFASERIRIEGQPARIAASSCTPLVLALHELATNAVKHGALSSAHGFVTLRWEATPCGHRILWREHGGPAVLPPVRVGLGRRLLKAQAGLEAVKLDFAPAGVACEICLPPAPS